MFTNQEALSLLSLPKQLSNGKEIIPTFSIRQEYPFQHEFTLNASDFVFKYDINQSSRNIFKLTLYLMEDETKIGLLRVDYNGQHQNPETIIDSVPSLLHPYVGKWFKYNEHHIHYYVEGYKTSLDWALPLANDIFPIKSISNSQDVINSFLAFNQQINLTTQFNIDRMIL